MNRVVLIGNLAGDLESRVTQSGIANCTFRLAVQRKYANQQGEREADFITIVCWRQLAENCARFLRKGSKAGVEGRMQTRSYQAQDGSKRYITEVVADNVEFLSPRTAEPPTQNQGAMAAQGFTEVDDDDLPF